MSVSFVEHFSELKAEQIVDQGADYVLGLKRKLEHHFEPRPNDDFKMEPD